MIVKKRLQTQERICSVAKYPLLLLQMSERSLNTTALLNHAKRSCTVLLVRVNISRSNSILFEGANFLESIIASQMRLEHFSLVCKPPAFLGSA